ncbi:MAG: uracil-DNA glycosylase family protein [Kordiimonadaceae bacterium]|jgi:uracil-DNA glycosylase|nr:uracil-DNA glycosylase family protein [Kordiimonadaceae bacterium]MBT6033175.1 uracil-DNA glycosylase family protein [Kordiimonadaceae bacterium]
MASLSLDHFLTEIRACTICESSLDAGVRPVLQVSENAKILIVGQAPGRRVHLSGIPFDDPSGDRLRKWMGIDKDTFYDASKVNIVPMGFCYPGTGKSGDFPPRKECAPQWRGPLMDKLSSVELTLVIGQYAIQWHLGSTRKKTLTETVKAWQEYWPDHVVLPHPSPRNNIWLKKNEWFEDAILPALKKRISELL